MTIQDIRSAMLSAGLTPPPDIFIDGRIHRFSPNGKPGDLAGWYVVYSNPLVCVYGDWRTGEVGKYVHREAVEHADIDFTSLIEAARKQRDEDQRKRHQEGKRKAGYLWNKAKPINGMDHPYLRQKGVYHHGTRVDRHGNLLVPVVVDEVLASLQFIKPDGSKQFLYGGKTRCGYFAISDGPGNAERIVIAEGFATAATLFEDTGYPVFTAFNAGNLLLLAQDVRQSYPDAEICIAGDDDWRTAGNPGKTAAQKAARAVGGKWLLPDFTGLDRGPKDTDFNDLSRLQREVGK